MKLPELILTTVAITIGITAGSVIAYHREQGDLNRKAYYECLRVTEEIAKSQQSNSSIRIVSTPHCTLR